MRSRCSPGARRRRSRERAAGARSRPSGAMGARRQSTCWVPRRAEVLGLRRKGGTPKAVACPPPPPPDLKPQDQGEEEP